MTRFMRCSRTVKHRVHRASLLQETTTPSPESRMIQYNKNVRAPCQPTYVARLIATAPLRCWAMHCARTTPVVTVQAD